MKPKVAASELGRPGGTSDPQSKENSRGLLGNFHTFFLEGCTCPEESL